MNIIKNLEYSMSPTCMIGDGVNDALALKYSPVVGALVHNLGSVFVILNSARLLKTKNNLNMNIEIEYGVTNKSKEAIVV